MEEKIFVIRVYNELSVAQTIQGMTLLISTFNYLITVEKSW